MWCIQWAFQSDREGQWVEGGSAEAKKGGFASTYSVEAALQMGSVKDWADGDRMRGRDQGSVLWSPCHRLSFGCNYTQITAYNKESY